MQVRFCDTGQTGTESERLKKFGRMAAFHIRHLVLQAKARTIGVAYGSDVAAVCVVLRVNLFHRRCPAVVTSLSGNASGALFSSAHLCRMEIQLQSCLVFVLAIRIPRPPQTQIHDNETYRSIIGKTGSHV